MSGSSGWPWRKRAFFRGNFGLWQAGRVHKALSTRSIRRADDATDERTQRGRCIGDFVAAGDELLGSCNARLGIVVAEMGWSAKT